MKRMKLKWLLLLCFVFTVLHTGTAQASASHPQMKIYCIYLGENAGDSILVESGGQYLLMDLGPEKAYPYIKNFLHKLKVTKLDLYISHTHADHTGGLEDGAGYEQFMRDFQVGKVYLPEKSIGSLINHDWNYEKFVDLYMKYNETADPNRSFIYLNAGSRFSFGDVRAEVIGPINMSNVSLSQFEEKNDYENNCSLVTKMVCGKTTYLATADALERQEKELVKKYGKNLKADIYKLSHHGYSSGNTAEFMQYVAPAYSFGPNSGVTGLTPANTTNHRVTYSARSIASQYGFCFMVGEEKEAIAIQVDNDKVNLYRESDLTKRINAGGWVKVFGADGVYEKYDYYYFGPDGKPLTGIQKIDGKAYYLGTGGCREIGRWTDGKYNSWRKYPLTGDAYGMRYFDRTTGEMKVGWLTVDKVKYYMDLKTGYRSSGLKIISGKKYFFRKAGDLVTNKFEAVSGKTRYFDQNGVMQTGFKTIKGNKYYFDKNGVLVKGGSDFPIVKIGKKYYAISKTGIIHTSGMRTYKEKGKRKLRYFNTKGEMKTGWFKLKGKEYYFDTKTGFAVTGLKKIGSKYYYFKDNGEQLKKNTVTLSKYKFKFNAKGVLTNVPKVSAVKLKGIKSAKGSVTVSWSRNKNATGYEVYYATKQKGTYKKAASVKSNKTLKYKINSLKKNTKYYIKIRAYKKLGGELFYSKYSNIKNIKGK